MLKKILSCLLSHFYVLEKFKIFNMLTFSLYVLKKKIKILMCMLSFRSCTFKKQKNVLAFYFFKNLFDKRNIF